MRPATVRLVDIGLSGGFDVATSFANSLIDSLTFNEPPQMEDGGYGPVHPAAEIELVRTRDPQTLACALTAEATILHILSHGRSNPGELGFESGDGETNVQLADLAWVLATDKVGIGARVVFADCCDGARRRFVSAMRDCLDHDVVYVGATRRVSWHECTLFGSNFYGSFFRDKGKGVDPLERGCLAAERAIRAYEAAVDGRCPFRVEILTPSRKARAALRAA